MMTTIIETHFVERIKASTFGKISVDNFLTSDLPLQKLSERGIQKAGTLRTNS